MKLTSLLTGILLLASAFVTAVPGAALAEPRRAGAVEVDVTPVMTGLDEPWALGFLPDGRAVVTERDGALKILDGTTITRVQGVPKVFAKGQGGLLDVLVPADHAQTQRLLFTYAKPTLKGGKTALAQAILEGNRLTGWTVLFEMTDSAYSGRHFGSRLTQDSKTGQIYMTIGDRGTPEDAQDLGNHSGTIILLNADGSVPGANPFNGDAKKEIWSYGHRNPQGLTRDASGRLWAVEHGPQGGDEINHIEPGQNYGWPVITYGEQYGGGKIGIGTHQEGMVQPKFHWTPSIAPSGYMIYSGKLFPQWTGHHFIGSLKFGQIAKVDPANWTEVRYEWPETGRVRDIREAPDGAIWFLDVVEGAAFRISPR